jgi:hypothetical protein
VLSFIEMFFMYMIFGLLLIAGGIMLIEAGIISYREFKCGKRGFEEESDQEIPHDSGQG